MAETVIIEFSGKPGTGKTIISKLVRQYLHQIGCLVEPLSPHADGDTLKITTTQELREIMSGRLLEKFR